MNGLELSSSTAIAPRTRGSEVRPIEPGRGRLGLAPLDQAAVAAFSSGQTAEIVEEARLLAEALAGEDGDGARVRLLARGAAAARSQQRVLEALLGDRLGKRDREGVELVSKVLDGVSRRLEMYTRGLASEAALRRRATVVIAHADTVSVGGPA